MGKLINMNDFNGMTGTMTPIKLTATSKGVGIMAQNKDVPLITEKMLTDAINKQEFEALTLVTGQPNLTVTEKNEISEMIKAICTCHKSMTKYSTGADTYSLLIAQSFQSVLMSMIEGMMGGPQTLSKLAAVAFKTVSKDFIMGLLKDMMKGKSYGVEGKEVKMDDEKE